MFISTRRTLGLAALCSLLTLPALAQTGIGTTAPDASAALDIVASTKGALLPRLTQAQRLAMGVGLIPPPATGLIVFQTDGTSGFYYNAGTPGTPDWQQLATVAGAAITATNGLTKTGNAIGLGGTLTAPTTIVQVGNTFSLTGGNVGIGTTAPASQLANTTANTIGTDFQGGSSGSLSWAASQSGYVGQFYNGDTQSGSNGVAIKINGTNPSATALDVSKGLQSTAGTSLLMVKASGNVGIGITAPLTRLSISPSTVEPKITLWDGGSATNHYGFGISGNQLNYHVDGAGSRHVFYAGGKNGDGTELLRIQGNGRVGIGTTAPAQLLQLGSVTYPGSALLRIGAGNGGAQRQWELGVQVDPANLNDGTGEYYDFALRDATANATRLLVEWNTGNVGIGTTAPGWKLDVAGNLRVANASGEFYINNFGGAGNTLLGTFNGAGGNGPQLRFTGVAAAGFMDIGQNTAGDFVVEGNDQPRLTVLNAGNVGIGSTAPSQALDVNGGILARAHSAVSTQGAYLHWNRTNGDGATWLLNQKGGGGAAAGIRFGAVTTGNAVTEWGRFLDNGNFGIGTTAPLYTLDVATSASLIGRLSSAHVGGTWWSLANTSAGAGGFHFITTGSANGEGPNKLLLTRGPAGSNTGYLMTMDGNTLNVGINTPAPTSTLAVNGSVSVPYATPITDLTLTSAHYTVRRAVGCNTITLPAPNTCAGRLYVIINTSGSGSNVALVTPSGIIFDDVTNAVITSLAPNNRLTVQSTGGDWVVIGR